MRLYKQILHHISIHAPSRERQMWPVFRVGVDQFQSTLPHGSDLVQVLVVNVGTISIHAPSRERLTDENNPLRRLIISIHAPSRERRNRHQARPRGRNFNPRSLTGATICQKRTDAELVFQSTLPHGSDRPADVHGGQSVRISIHAPSRERRIFRHNQLNTCRISIHAPSRERPAELFGALQPSEFQSTLHHGSDPRRCQSWLWRYHFNPRSLTGATAREVSLYAFREISIHAPSRERPVTLSAGLSLRRFQSTLPHGSDQ